MIAGIFPPLAGGPDLLSAAGDEMQTSIYVHGLEGLEDRAQYALIALTLFSNPSSPPTSATLVIHTNKGPGLCTAVQPHARMHRSYTTFNLRFHASTGKAIRRPRSKEYVFIRVLLL